MKKTPVELRKELACILINLDESTERLGRMCERLGRMGLEFVRIPAVSSKNAEFGEDVFSPKKFARRVGKAVNPREIGCYLSHYGALKLFLETGRKYALILEDDMIFDDDFVETLEYLVNMDFEWDFVKLNTANSRGFFNLKVASLPNGRRLVASVFPKTKLGAYLVNRKAALSLTEKLLPMTVPADHEMIKFWKYGIRQYSVFPSPSVEEGAPSTIGGYGVLGKSNRNRFHKRIPVFFYRYLNVQLVRTLNIYKLLKRR